MTAQIFPRGQLGCLLCLVQAFIQMPPSRPGLPQPPVDNCKAYAQQACLLSLFDFPLWCFFIWHSLHFVNSFILPVACLPSVGRKIYENQEHTATPKQKLWGQALSKYDDIKWWVPTVTQQVTNLTSIHENALWSLASLSRLRIRCFCDLWCVSNMGLGSWVAVAVAVA